LKGNTLATTHTNLSGARYASLMLLSLLAACGGGGGDAAAPPPPAPTPPCVASPPPAPPTPGSLPPQVTFAMSNGQGVNGDVVITLNPTASPITVANFLSYVNSGFYNCTVIHRHVPGFVLQGGGWTAPLLPANTVPNAKPTGAPIVLEDNNGLLNQRLTLAMARTGQPDSATSQFFINLADNTQLNRTATARGYAVFGSITAGADVVTAITSASCSAFPALLFNGECIPNPNVVITRAAQTR
jgi:peptidyl-prolyl cis-trans isomerase A (cyclophilin A)